MKKGASLQIRACSHSGQVTIMWIDAVYETIVVIVNEGSHAVQCEEADRYPTCRQDEGQALFAKLINLIVMRGQNF